MRILMISKACIAREYRKKLVELAKLPKVELTCVVPPYWGRRGSRQMLEPGGDGGYKLIVSPMRFNGWFHIHRYPELGRITREIAPDIVHIDEEPYNLAAAHAMWYAKRQGAKALFFSWQNLHRQYPFPFSSLERICYAGADYALAGNAEAIEVMRAKGYPGPLELIPQFGVDETTFAPGERERDGSFVVGYAGRLVSEKGVDLIIDAVSCLSGSWRLLIMGDGPERKVLASLSEKAGVADRVEFLPPVPTSQVPEFLRRLDALVLPSETRHNWKEQFGRVLIEAMSCQVPVIGSDSGEIPNVIGKAGLLFPEADAVALADQLATVQNEPDPTARWGKPGRRRVLKHYTQARIAARTYQVYRRMMKSAPPKRR